MHDVNTVILLHHGGETVRGSEQCLIENVKALHAAGFRTILLRNHPCVDERLTGIVDEVVPFEWPELMISGLGTRLPIFRYMRAFASLAATIRRERAIALLANGGLPCQLGVPVARLCGVPLICQFHHPANRRYLYLWLVKHADRLVFPSEFTRSIVQNRLRADGVVIYNGVDTERFTPAVERRFDLRKSLDIPEDALVFGQVAALQPHKRQDLLIRAFSAALGALPNAYLVLVGTGPQCRHLEHLAESLGVSHRVRFAGYVASTVDYFQHVIDVNVLASAEEGLGISVLEGSATGLPAIVADATGLRETVIPLQTALDFPVDDEEALRDRLIHLGNDPSLRVELGRAGRVFVNERFAAERYRQGIVRIVTDSTSSSSAR